MINGFCQRALRFSIAVLCITALSGVGGVAAHQRGDASLPTNDDAWTELGIEFISPEQPSASTITGDTYVLPSTGTEVVVADGVSASDPADSTFEDQVLFTIPGGIGAVAVLPGLGYPVSIMEAYVEGFAESMENVEEIEIQEDRSTASGLYIVNPDSSPLYLYITVDAVTSPGNFILQVAVSTTGSIDKSVNVLRDNVLIDGVSMFDGVDEQALQRLVDEDIGP